MQKYNYFPIWQKFFLISKKKVFSTKNNKVLLVSPIKAYYNGLQLISNTTAARIGEKVYVRLTTIISMTPTTPVADIIFLFHIHLHQKRKCILIKGSLSLLPSGL